MMTVSEAIAYINNYTWSTSKMGLSRTQELLQKMGNPHQRLRFVHVTGSNGKGSTCVMTASVLQQAGFKVGLYTSPYVCAFNERIQINGNNITDEELSEITESVAGIADSMEDHPTQFELMTAIAMEYFCRQKCEIVVLEVGMGGALDSTNVIPAPVVAAFTNIGLEHTEYLGDTIAEIAATKGGIIKPGCHVICYDSGKEATDTIRSICQQKGVSYTPARDEAQLLSADLRGQSFRYRDNNYEIALLGPHQVRNALVAIEIIKVLQKEGYPVTEEDIRKGLAEAKWPARFEVLTEDPLFILDGGHNPQCAKALTRTLDQVLNGQKVWFLTGVLADKDYGQIIDIIAGYAKGAVCVTPDNPRALPAKDYAEAMNGKGIKALAAPSIREGIDMIQKEAGNDAVIAFGSLYMAGTIRTVILSEDTSK